MILNIYPHLAQNKILKVSVGRVAETILVSRIHTSVALRSLRRSDLRIRVGIAFLDELSG